MTFGRHHLLLLKALLPLQLNKYDTVHAFCCSHVRQPDFGRFTLVMIRCKSKEQDDGFTLSLNEEFEPLPEVAGDVANVAAAIFCCSSYLRMSRIYFRKRRHDFLTRR